MSIGNSLYFSFYYLRCTFLPWYRYPKQREFLSMTGKYFEKYFPEVSTGIYAKEDSNRNHFLINWITFSEQGDDIASVSFQLHVLTLLAKPVPSHTLLQRSSEAYVLIPPTILSFMEDTWPAFSWFWQWIVVCSDMPSQKFMSLLIHQ